MNAVKRKVNMTRGDVLALSKKVFYLGYCDPLWVAMTHTLEPFAFNHGIYGWNWDALAIGDGVTVVSGYRNLCGERPPEDIARRYYKALEKLDKELNISEHWEAEKRIARNFCAALVKYTNER